MCIKTTYTQFESVIVKVYLYNAIGVAYIFIK